jgi:hypothetical protein
MCEIYYGDYEPFKFYRTRRHRARTLHRCDVCNATIEPKQEYQRFSYADEYGAHSECVCTACCAGLDEFSAEHGGFVTQPSCMTVLVSECVENADEGDPEREKWQMLLNDISARAYKAVTGGGA